MELAHDDADWVMDNLSGLPQHALTPHADEMVRIAQENADWIVRSVALQVLQLLPQSELRKLHVAALVEVMRNDRHGEVIDQAFKVLKLVPQDALVPPQVDAAALVDTAKNGQSLH